MTAILPAIVEFDLCPAESRARSALEKANGSERLRDEVHEELMALRADVEAGKYGKYAKFYRICKAQGWSEMRLRYYLEQRWEQDQSLTAFQTTPEVVDSPSGNLMDVHYSSETPEWYTPPEIIARTEKTLGKIDLDPCSGPEETVPAKHHFTKEQDGLRFDWCGRVYMNPPYGREIVAWVEKLVAEHQAGRTKEAIALVPARVDTDWFRMFRDFAVCFVDGRLKFSGHENSAPFPSAAVYLGPNVTRFAKSFKDIGDVWVRWHG